MKQAAETKPRPKRGRPPLLTTDMRRQRILDAAERVFTSVGYGAATIEEIARTAGMSKKTLYGLFADKRAIFTALTDVIDFYPTEALYTERTNSRAELRDRLLTLAELALSKRQLEMTRLVISEARHCPELAEDFRAKAVSKGKAYLARALQSYLETNPRITIPDVDKVAITLFSGIIGDLHFRALLGETPASRRNLLSHIDSTMDLMLPDPEKG